MELGQEWAAQQRERLKVEGGTAVLVTLRQLQETCPHVGLDEPLGYLTKREAMLQYPQFQAAGWPIASGMVESANKLVVEARLKGACMHWHRHNVNPMLALRNVVCNEHWGASWPTMAAGLRQRRYRNGAPVASSPPPENSVRAYFLQMQRVHRAWEAQQRALEKARSKSRKPPPDHPWRQSYMRVIAKK